MTFLQKLSVSIVVALFSVVLLLVVFIQPEYDFADFPYFAYRGIPLCVALLAVSLVSAGIMKLGNKTQWNAIPPILFYLLGSFAFLFLVPMIPVSDQKVVFDLAESDLADPNGYMIVNVNVIPTILYVYSIAVLTGKTLWGLKIVNVAFGLATLILTAKLYGLLVAEKDISRDKELFSISERKLLWLGAVFLPAFFYSNHIYNEVPSVAMSMLMLYLVVRNDNSVWMRILTVLISCLQFVLRQSGIILVIAAAMYIFFYQKKRVYSIIYLISVILAYVLVEKWYTLAVVGEGAQGYPVWSFIRMGMNEAEFGFQDHSHTSDASFWDCIERYKEYGPIKVLTIYAKKTFWIWGEGTYQSGRYGLGYPDNTYEYETFVTRFISGSQDRKLRIVINMVLRAQYMFYLFLSIVGSWIAKKKEKFSVFFFIICGFFLFFLIWEIKSRYLYGLYPVFLILALYGWDNSEEIRTQIKKVIPVRK